MAHQVEWFFFCYPLFFWRAAWHSRLKEAQISMRKRAQVPTKSVPRQGIGKLSQSGNWQGVPGRDFKPCPGRALANIPRQGTGKRSQATAKRPRQGMQAFQAGNAHWQAFPGLELASIQARNCKLSQAGRGQMIPSREP